MDKRATALALVVLNDALPKAVKSEVADQMTPGPQGATGEQGLPGKPGRDGKEGHDGVVGAKGAPGDIGTPGEPGLRGPKGLSGANGVNGKSGLKGVQGEKGVVGEVGPAGPPGPQGERGPIPDHKWIGTQLQFKHPDGTWGKLVQLKGPVGKDGGGFSSFSEETIINNIAGGDDEVPYAKRVDVISDTLIYKGKADPGEIDSAATWRVSRVTLNAEGDITEEWADGVSTFTKVWANRASLTYS